MKPVLIAGTVIVNLALICYSVGIITEQKIHRINRKIIVFLTLGVIFDLTATACMITGSGNSPFSLHGLLGYSSLAAMIIETCLAWRHWLFFKSDKVARGLHLYSRLAYIWWVLAYITGAGLVFFSKA